MRKPGSGDGGKSRLYCIACRRTSGAVTIVGEIQGGETGNAPLPEQTTAAHHNGNRLKISFENHAVIGFTGAHVLKRLVDL